MRAIGLIVLWIVVIWLTGACFLKETNPVSKEYPCGTRAHACSTEPLMCCWNGETCGGQPGSGCQPGMCCYGGDYFSATRGDASAPVQQWQP